MSKEIYINYRPTNGKVSYLLLVFLLKLSDRDKKKDNVGFDFNIAERKDLMMVRRDNSTVQQQ